VVSLSARTLAAGQIRWEVPLFLVGDFAVRPHACGGARPLEIPTFSGWAGSLSARWELPLFLVGRVRCPPARLRRGRSAENSRFFWLSGFSVRLLRGIAPRTQAVSHTTQEVNKHGIGTDRKSN
jgi:hypothetical protein